MYDKILFTGDILRLQPGHNAIHNASFQHPNILWLHSLLKGAVQQATGLGSDVVSWQSTGGVLDVPSLFDAAGQSSDFQGWLNIYNRTQISSLEAEIAKSVFEGVFVIGFELSPYLQALLNHIDVSFVNLAISPVRFGPDFYFLFESNRKEILQAAKSHCWSVEDMRLLAEHTSAVARLTPVPPIIPGSALFCGQVLNDASLIDRARMVSAVEYLDELTRMAEAVPHLYYKRHPHATGDNAILDFFDRIPNGSVLDADIYSLLSHPDLERICAISSSVLFEAQLFGKKTTRFLKNQFDHGDGSDCSFVGGEALLPDFWADALGTTYVKHPSPVEAVANPISKTLKANWKKQPHVRTIAEFPALPFWKETKFDKSAAANANLMAQLKAQSTLPDSWGAWLRKPVTALKLRAPACSVGPIVVKMVFRTPGLLETPYPVRVLSNGKVVLQTTVKKVRQVEVFELNAKALDEQRSTELRIECATSVVPNAVSDSKDTRELFLGLESVVLYPRDNRVPLSLSPTRVAFADGKPLSGSPGCNLAGGSVAIASKGTKHTFRFTERPKSDLSLTFDTAEFAPTQDAIRVYAYQGDVLLGTTGRIAQGGSGEMHLRRAATKADGTLELSFQAVPETGWGTPKQSHGISVSFDALEFAPASLTAPPKIEGPQDGVAVIGQLRISTGMGVAARNTVKALSMHFGSENVSAINFDASQHLETDFTMSQRVGHTKRKINIFLVPPPVMQMARTNGLERVWDDAYSICYGAWELPKLPSHLANASLFDEYWGISGFVRDAALASGLNAKAVPLAVNVDVPARLSTRKELGMPEDRFVFLYTYCVDSTLTRKNPMGAIKAFQKAFPNRSTPVSLVLKCKRRQANAKTQAEQDKIIKIAQSDPRIVIIEKELDIDVVKSLYLACDAYVTLHRSEGFALTAAEAMGYGKPTIGTGWSGNLEFMTKENSFLVDYDLVDMAKTDYHAQSQHWAEPNISDAAKKMSMIFEDPMKRAYVARKGWDDIHSKFSLAAVSRRLGAEIEDLNGKLK